jgi:hypothetical protein
MNPFVTHVGNYPFGLNVLDNTSVLLLGIVMAPVTVLFGPLATVNLLYILSFPLSAGAAYLLARRFVDWRPAAFAAGLLYGFSPYMVGQGAGHLHLIFVPIPPLIFLVLHELFIQQRGSPVRWGVTLGLLVVAQFFISTEVLVTTAIMAGLVLIILAFAFRRQVLTSLQKAWPGLATATGLSLIVLAYPLHEAMYGLQHVYRTFGFLEYRSTLVTPVLPNPYMHFATAHMRTLAKQALTTTPENGGYLGVPLVLLVLVAPFVIRRAAVRVAAGMVVIAFVLTMGASFKFGLTRFSHVADGLWLPGALLLHIPQMRGAAPDRFAIYMDLFAGVVLALTLEELRTVRLPLIGQRTRGSHAPSGPHGGAVLPAIVAVVVLLPLLPAWPYRHEGEVRVPSYFTTSAVDALPAGSPTLVYPVPTSSLAQPMVWQAMAGMRFKMVGGYYVLPAGNGGQDWWAPTLTASVSNALVERHAVARTPTLRRQLISQLSSWHVQSVVAAPGGADPKGFFTWLIGRPPDAQKGGMLEWYHIAWRTPGS